MGASCPATREAVLEQEERGEVGCPICGRSAESHPAYDATKADPGPDQPHGLEGPEDGQETVQGHDRAEGDGMALIERNERRWTIFGKPIGADPRDGSYTTVSGPSVRGGEAVEVVPASALRGAVEALRRVDKMLAAEDTYGPGGRPSVADAREVIRSALSTTGGQ